MAKPFLRILIYLFINVICTSASINPDSENLSKQDYEIVDFNDQNTTVSL